MWEELEKQKVDRINERAGNLNEVDNINCDKCKNKGYVVVLDDNYNMKSIECECVKKRNIYWELKNSGLEDDFKINTFENYLTKHEWQKRNKQLALRYIENVKNEWLIITGETGSGKTHLGTAISKALIEKGFTYRYMKYTNEIKDLVRISNSFGEDMIIENEKRMNELLKPDVLYIDDFLKVDDRSLNYVKNTTFTLLDGRYKTGKITIITTEKTLGEINSFDKAILGRIVERAGQYILANEGKDKNVRLNKL